MRELAAFWVGWVCGGLFVGGAVALLFHHGYLS